MKQKKRKTTKKEFAEFKRGFNDIVEKLGLKGYEVFFELAEMEDNYAQISTHENGKSATVQLCTEMEEREHVGWSPYGSGVHEALHLLLRHLTMLAGWRYVRPDEIGDTEHDVIRRLEKVL